MRDAINERIAGTLTGRGAASPEARARVDALLREAPPLEPAPAGLRRAVLSAVREQGALAGARRTPLMAPWMLVAAACVALFVSVLAVRQQPVKKPAVQPGAAGPIATMTKQLTDRVKKLPTTVESPLMDEARRLALDTKRAANVVTAAWRRPARTQGAPETTVPAAPATGSQPAPPAGSAPVRAPAPQPMG